MIGFYLMLMLAEIFYFAVFSGLSISVDYYFRCNFAL